MRRSRWRLFWTRVSQASANKDRPDLQSPDGVSLGIEVTRAMPESKEAARSMLKEIIDIGETVKISECGPAAQEHRSGQDCVRDHSRELRVGKAGQQGHQRPRLGVEVQFQRFRSGETLRSPFRRREEQASPCADPQGRRQRAASGRADERRGREHDPRPGGRSGKLRQRCARRDQPRPSGSWDRIATHVLAYEGDSNVVFFEGNYAEYEENRKARLGNTEPKRFKYKKLME